MCDDKVRIGLIVPSSNTVMEPDFHRRLGRDYLVSTTRIFLEAVTREAEVSMIEDEFPRSLKLIETVHPRVVVFGCTSAGSLGGVSHDAELARAIERATRARGVTVVGSVLVQLAAVKAARVAVFTPYEPDLTQSVADCVLQGGYEVACAAGMGIVDNRTIGKVLPAEIVEFVSDRMEGVSADCVFLSCTNWQAIDAIDALQSRLGLPVVTSNQATIESVRAQSGQPALHGAPAG